MRFDLVRFEYFYYDSNFCLKKFVNSAVSHTYQKINLIFRAFCSRNLVLMTRVYTTYVRPLLSIGILLLHMVTLYNIYALYEIDSIEMVHT